MMARMPDVSRRTVLGLGAAAACGAVGAIAGTFGMFHARRFAGRVTGISDPYIGAIEDVVAIAIAATVVARLVG